MDIRKILNPEEPTPTASTPSAPSRPPVSIIPPANILLIEQPPKKDRPTQGERGDAGSKDWEELRRKRGMPTEGLNTFRVRNQ